jgi:hypothetical protein
MVGETTTRRPRRILKHGEAISRIPYETAPARRAAPASAPLIEFAAMNPVAEMKPNSGATRPESPPHPVRAATAAPTPASAAITVPARSSRSPPSRSTRRALTRLAAMTPTMPSANSTP